MNRVGFTPRLLALMLDVLLFLPVVIGVTFYDAVSPRGPGPYWSGRDAVIPIAWLLYTSSEMFWAATPGKAILGQRITAANGEPADFWTRLLRWQTKQMPFICSALIVLTGFVPFYMLGGFMNTILLAGCFAALNDGKRAWHDEWAGTSVVLRKRRVAMPPPLPVR